MASPAKLKKVTDSTGRGKGYLPSSGGGGKIPSGTAPATPKPKAAKSSGKTGKFPSGTVTAVFPLRSSGGKSSSQAVGNAMKAQFNISPMPLRSNQPAK